VLRVHIHRPASKDAGYPLRSLPAEADPFPFPCSVTSPHERSELTGFVFVARGFIYRAVFADTRWLSAQHYAAMVEYVPL
jgi:hypothetical protein